MPPSSMEPLIELVTVPVSATSAKFIELNLKSHCDTSGIDKITLIKKLICTLTIEQFV